MAFWARKSEGVGLIDRPISFQDFPPMWSWSTNVTDRRTDRQTDGRTTCSLNTALCTSASRGKKPMIAIDSRSYCSHKCPALSTVIILHCIHHRDSLLLAAIQRHEVDGSCRYRDPESGHSSRTFPQIPLAYAETPLDTECRTSELELIACVDACAAVV